MQDTQYVIKFKYCNLQFEHNKRKNYGQVVHITEICFNQSNNSRPLLNLEPGF